MRTKSLMPAICLAALALARPDAVVGSVRNDNMTTEDLLKKVSQQLDEVTDNVKGTAEEALKQAKRSGEVSQETKDKADKLLTEQTALNNSVTELKNSLEGIKSQTLEISQQVADGIGGGGPAPAMTLGQAFVAEDEQIKNFKSAGAKGHLLIDVSNAITTAAGSAGGLIYHEEERDPVRIPRRRLLIRDLLTKGKTSSDLVKYRKQTVQDNKAAMVAEGAAMPESSFGWDKATSEVKKIAHHTNITEEALADSDFLQTEIDSELRYGLDLEEEKQILAGDGQGENLKGLLTEAVAFVAAAGLPNATRIDRLRLAILQVALADYVATSFVMNPTDWAAIDLLKDDQKRYIFGNVNSVSTPKLWGKDVVETNTMSVGEWLAGDLAMAATYYDRQQADVLISSEHGDNFIEGMLTMRGSKRVALAIKRVAATVKGNFVFG
ncbi:MULTISPECIES: phage major capsid protein [unclassified Pseudovibrio]|uniref:phage major capsid protein n=1 Tax=unclassified Pseudovibrio TaxID=2627060 RepID=UPI0007AECCBD|nr:MULTISPECIES: phage major capsid protein [unclassified Pseudovibrio]KZL02793.1 Phage capsid family protein [Pseudovibrio sp. W74]KZL07496.1 Phage capsid family protein [Pseudovibrio sp. Ad14]